VRSIVTDLGRMSMETTLDHGHTVDIGPCVSEDAPIQGVVFEEVLSLSIGDAPSACSESSVSHETNWSLLVSME
jgi:hypothetical protein